MDWIDEQFDKIGKWLRNQSLRRTLVAYITICIIVVIILYTVTIAVCEHWENIIWSQYSDVDAGDNQSLYVYLYDYSKLTKQETILANMIEFVKSCSAFVYSIGGIIGVSLLFYNKKLKYPFEILKKATDKIGNNDLDIEIYYESKDEMGELCRSFDLMRKQLILNNQSMWDMMEEQKRLNAAFAHDLRTPLTVLRGYTDFLKEYIPEDKISREKLLSTLSLMSSHIERLERYSNTMKEIHSFEEIPVSQEIVEWKNLQDKVGEIVKVVNGKNGINVTLENEANYGDNIYLDEEIFMEVFDNLLSNALRYARKEIKVILDFSEEDNLVMLSVADDGKGFSPKTLCMAAKPYFTDSMEDKSNHFGIGLYICKLLCEKHRGWLCVANGIQQGAFVTASFYSGKMKENIET